MSFLGFLPPPYNLVAKIAGPILLAGLLVLGVHLGIEHFRDQGRAAQLAADKIVMDAQVKAIGDAREAARAADQKHADDVNAARTQAKKESDDEYASQLADARARAAAYIRLHPAPSGAAEGGGRPADLPGPAGSADHADGADQHAVVPAADIDACTEAVTRLQNVQSWWSKLKAGPQ